MPSPTSCGFRRSLFATYARIYAAVNIAARSLVRGPQAAPSLDFLRPSSPMAQCDARGCGVACPSAERLDHTRRRGPPSKVGAAGWRFRAGVRSGSMENVKRLQQSTCAALLTFLVIAIPIESHAWSRYHEARFSTDWTVYYRIQDETKYKNTMVQFRFWNRTHASRRFEIHDIRVRCEDRSIDTVPTMGTYRVKPNGKYRTLAYTACGRGKGDIIKVLDFDVEID